MPTNERRPEDRRVRVIRDGRPRGAVTVDYDWITNRVATEALSSAEDVEVLADAGVTAVVDARAELDDAPLFANHNDVLYLWNPTEDDGAPKPTEYWAKTLAFSLPILTKPHTKLYYHCAYGHNRGPSNAACVLMALGWPKDDVVSLIQARRPVTVGRLRYADDAWAAVQTLGFA